jgi:hypothetical protein
MIDFLVWKLWSWCKPFKWTCANTEWFWFSLERTQDHEDDDLGFMVMVGKSSWLIISISYGDHDYAQGRRWSYEVRLLHKTICESESF